MQRSIRRIALVGLATCALCYVAFGVLVVINERSMLFPAPHPVERPSLAGGFQLLQITGAATLAIALYLPPQPGKPVVVHFHGNAEQLAGLTGLGERFGQRGIGFFAVEYPAYGLDEGVATTEYTIYEVAEHELEYLRCTLQIPDSRIVLEGQSLGTGVAVEMAKRGYGSRLILISPYTSIADLGRDLLPWYPRRLMVLDEFDTESKAAGINMPTLIIHGTADDIVPFEMGKRLAALFPHATLDAVAGAGHNDLRQLKAVSTRMLDFASPP